MIFKLESTLKTQFKHVPHIVFAYSKNRKTVPVHRTPKRFALFLDMSIQYVPNGLNLRGLVLPEVTG